MKAFVINETQIIKAGAMVAVVMVLMFVSGYFVGSNYATFHITSDDAKRPVSEIVMGNAKKLEEKNIDNTNVDNNSTLKKEKKSETKKLSKKEVDKNTIKKTGDKKAEKRAEKRTADKKIEKKKTENKAQKNKHLEKKRLENKRQEKKKNNEKKTDKPTKKTAITTPEKTIERPGSDATIDNNKKAGTKKLGDKYYSIQAGMFSSEMNANSFIKKLADRGYDAYMVSFESSSGNTKYNVRVGKFEKRESASELLDKFQKSFSSPAYVVITQ